MSIYNAVKLRKEYNRNLIETHSSSDFFLTFEPKLKQDAKTVINEPQGAQQCRNVLILDSSFNPPTKAHAALLSQAIKARPDHYDHGLLLFSTQNADKKLTGASVVQRAQMMELLARQYELQDIPVYVGLTTQARFIDKARIIQQWYERQGQTGFSLKLHFILGYDTLLRLFDSKYYLPKTIEQALDPFLESCHLVCVDRPMGKETDENSKVAAFWNSPLVRSYSDRLSRLSLDDSQLATISSTLARKAASQRNQEALFNLLDADVATFVFENNIYI